MGPEKSFEKSLGITITPVFEPEQCLLTLRKKIPSLVDLILTAAKNEDEKLYKTVFHT